MIALKIRVMSYNVFHCENVNTGKIDIPAYAELIRKSKADIIGLNEVRGKGILKGYTAQLEALAAELGFYSYFARAIYVARVNPYGNAILSRFPIVKAETVMIPDPVKKSGKNSYETRCLLRADIAVGNGLTVLVTHFGLNCDEQQNAMGTLMSNIPQGSCVLMGDFNVEPDNPVLLPVRERMQDTAAFFENEKLSFPSDKPEKKIDYIFTDKGTGVLSADILPEVLSDHRPHVAQLEL